jgi:hypothetical protein
VIEGVVGDVVDGPDDWDTDGGRPVRGRPAGHSTATGIMAALTEDGLDGPQ